MSHTHPYSTINNSLTTYRQLEAIGLANIEALLDKWGLEWRPVPGAKNEIDILASWRGDRNFGSFRFNIAKGVGADFAERPITQEDLDKLGIGFTVNDITHKTGRHNTSTIHLLDIVQRLNNCNYANATQILKQHLAELGPNLVEVSADATLRRQRERIESEAKRKQYARDLWESSKHHNLKGSIGEQYLKSRKIEAGDELNIRFHSGIWYKPNNATLPALLFKVQASPKGELTAVHRIYLDPTGAKAKIDNPKMALGKITGNGIWFGRPCSTLHIAEGPETALSLVMMGCEFVCCAVSAVNLGNINVELVSSEIDGGLKEVIVCADSDGAGTARALEAAQKYSELCDVKIVYPKEGYKDFNDELRQLTRSIED